jgi:hypothetical protein
VRAEDPNGIASMTVHYSIEGAAFSNTAMTLGANGLYTGTIPGQTAGVSVQFYVQGQDTLGATSMFPAAGPNSRAMYEVNDGIGPTTQIESIRIVARSTEAANLLVNTNIMSNQNIGATIIYNNSKVFYDVGIRLKGSSASRGDPTWAGSYSVEFNPDHLFRGVYDEIALDSTGRGVGAGSSGQQQVQLLVNQILNHAGNGLASHYDDLVHVVSPNTAHSGVDTLQLARYSNDFLDENYENGSDGNLYEYEIVYYSDSTTNGNVEGPKIQNVAGHLDAMPQDYGDDADRYRWNYLLKNNRDKQDFSQIIAMNKAFSLSGNDFIDAISAVIDVEQWLRTFAAANAMGVSDTFATLGNYHNISFYVRPSDGKLVMLPWDWDESFRLSATSTIFPGDLDEPLRKLLTFTNSHLYLSHLYDIATHELTTGYMNSWVDYFFAIGQQDPSFLNQKTYIGQRHNSIISQINNLVPFSTQFNITTNNGNPMSVATPTVTLAGTGYVDFHTIRVRGNSQPLAVSWSSYANWQAIVPLGPGTNNLILDAYDVRGDLIHSDSISVTTSANASTPLNSLRITELNYHPGNPPAGSAIVDPEEYEFIELTNIGAFPIDLANCAFITGVTFTFQAMSVAPGQHIVLVKNSEAFIARYGSSIPIAGVYSGSLSNGGEQLVLNVGLQTIQDFTYLDDDWIPAADGPGYSMVVVDSSAVTSAWGTPAGWRRSANINGSPGVSDPPYVDGDYNRNGVADAADYILWRKTLGTTVTIFSGADGDGDGTIDQDDYGVWRAQFGQSVFPAGAGGGALTSAALVESVASRQESPAAQLPASRSVDNRDRAVNRFGLSTEFLANRSSPSLLYGPNSRLLPRLTSAIAVNEFDDSLVAWLASQSETEQAKDDSRADDLFKSGSKSGVDSSAMDQVDAFYEQLAASRSRSLQIIPHWNWP